MSSSIQIVCKIFLFIVVVGAETADNKRSCSKNGDTFFYNGQPNNCKELKNDLKFESLYERALSMGCCCPMTGPHSCEVPKHCEVCKSLNSKLYTNSDVKLSFKNGIQIESGDTLSLDEEVVCTIPPNSNFPNVSIQITQRVSKKERSTSCDGYKCTHKMLASLKTLPFDLHCSVRLSDEDEPRFLTREVNVTVTGPKDSALQLKKSFTFDTKQNIIECEAKASNFVKLRIHLCCNKIFNSNHCHFGGKKCTISHQPCLEDHFNVSCWDSISHTYREFIPAVKYSTPIDNSQFIYGFLWRFIPSLIFIIIFCFLVCYCRHNIQKKLNEMYPKKTEQPSHLNGNAADRKNSPKQGLLKQ